MSDTGSVTGGRHVLRRWIVTRTWEVSGDLAETPADAEAAVDAGIVTAMETHVEEVDAR